MKFWILAAGLISIVPLSEGMLWLKPPPVVEVEQGYELAEIAALNKLAARKPTQSERAAELHRKQAKTLAKVYGITSDNIDSYRDWR